MRPEVFSVMCKSRFLVLSEMIVPVLGSQVAGVIGMWEFRWVYKIMASGRN